jgi:hypothetical protein
LPGRTDAGPDSRAGDRPGGRDAAALLAVGPGEEIVVEDRHLDQAMHELVVGGGELIRRLLGADG